MFGLALAIPGLASAEGPVAPDVNAPPIELAPPVVVVDPGDCQLSNHANGRLAAVLCGEAQEPIFKGAHRLQNFTGTLTTHYPHGGVREVLTLKDGFLDGVVELYDDVGHLGERLIFQAGKRQDSDVEPLPPAPTPEVLASLDTGRPPSVAQMRTDNGGIGADLRMVTSLARNAYGAYWQMGPALDMLMRTGERLSLELRVEFQQTVSAPVGYKRIDVPLSVGARIHWGQSRLRPFVVLGLGANYAWRSIPGDIVAQPSESAWMFDLHGGLGLTARLSRSWWFIGDLRLSGRFRTDDKPRLTATNSDGVQAELLGNQTTTQLGLGFIWMS